jgi:hypothetical protein
LGEDADLGPVRIVARTPRAGLHRIRIALVEDVHDLDVAELLEPAQCIRFEALIQLDRRGDLVPVVVDGVGARRAHAPDRDHLHADIFAR